MDEQKDRGAYKSVIVVKALLAGIILASTSMGVFRAAQKISCIHLFQVQAFSMLTHRLHTKRPMTVPRMVCGEMLWVKVERGFLEVRSHFQARSLKLGVGRNIVNEKISSR